MMSYIYDKNSNTSYYYTLPIGVQVSVDRHGGTAVANGTSKTSKFSRAGIRSHTYMVTSPPTPSNRWPTDRV